MADAIISAVAERIIALLEEQATFHINLVRGAEKEVANLAKELKTVRNVLDDAERRGYKEKSVKDWLSRLEQTSYEMEDVLDEWNYAILKLRIEGDRSDDPVVAAPKNKVWSFIPSSSCLCCKKVALRHGIAKKIIDVKQRLDEVLKEKDRYSFVISQPIADVSWRDPSTSFTDVEVVCGRDSDRDILVKKNLGKQDELGVQVVSVVGVGGLGKTTIAQLVYNDSRVVNSFESRIWICVSDPFDLAAIAKGILENMGRERIPTQLDVLLKDVRESISGKKFLLVLDDVWTEESKKWEPLRSSLRYCGEGSKVLVTTRNERVAITMGTIENDIYRPQQLSHEDCWSLLCRISLSRRREEDCRKFHDIGKKIATKCKGLPLAACVLGSLLQFKNSLEEWESVHESEIWELEEAEQQLFPHLLLSYNELSPALKHCFSYCAVFPKDSEIDVERLIENWIAQGYLGSDDGDLELKGRECFQNLAMRSLFLDFQKGDLDEKIMFCKMHDIVHDFAQSLRKDRSIVGVGVGMKMENCERCSFSLVSSVKTYRSLVSYNDPFICDCLTSLRVLCRTRMHGIQQEMGHLIHLRWLELSYNEFCKEDIKIICQLYNLHFLRLQKCSLDELPSEIGNLIQLRNLCLSDNNSLMELPKEIGNLIQLTRLNLSGNISLKELPEEIGNLIQLRHLDFSCDYSLQKLPESLYKLINLKHILNEFTGEELFSQGLSKLINLRTLREFWGARGCSKLGWLKNLNRLTGSLKLNIKMLDDSEDMIEDAREAHLRKKMHLQALEIWFNDEMHEENDSRWMNVMDALEPNPDLQKLHISYYRGSKLAGWITSPLFQLRSIELSWSDRMQLVGREFLGITGDSGVRSSSNTTVGFPKLKTLIFDGCQNWKEWEDITVEEENSASVELMPCLTELLIDRCSCLAALPERLLGKKALSLKYVEIKDDLSGELIKRYKYREGATWVDKGPLQVPFGPKCNFSSLETSIGFPSFIISLGTSLFLLPLFVRQSIYILVFFFSAISLYFDLHHSVLHFFVLLFLFSFFLIMSWSFIFFFGSVGKKIPRSRGKTRTTPKL